MGCRAAKEFADAGFPDSISPVAGSALRVAQKRRRTFDSGGFGTGLKLSFVSNRRNHEPPPFPDTCTICNSARCGSLSSVNGHVVVGYLGPDLWRTQTQEPGRQQVLRRVKQLHICDLRLLYDACGSCNHLLAIHEAICDVEQRGYLVLEKFVAFCSQVDNTGHLMGSVWSELKVRELCGAVLRALAHLHDLGLHHGDVRPRVIVTTEFAPSVFKLDACAATSTSRTSRIRDVYFAAPERRFFSSPAVDVWSLGCVVFTLLYSHVPFGAGVRCGKDVLELVSCADQPKQLQCPRPPDGPLDLIARMLEPMGSQRIPAAAALRHPWIAEEGGGDAAAAEQPPPREASPVGQLSADVLQRSFEFCAVCERPKLQAVCRDWGVSARRTFCWRLLQRRRVDARSTVPDVEGVRATAFRWYLAAVEFLYTVIEDELHTLALASGLCCVTLKRTLALPRGGSLAVHNLVMQQNWSIPPSNAMPLRHLRVIAAPLADDCRPLTAEPSVLPAPVYWPLGDVRVTPCAKPWVVCSCPAARAGHTPANSWLGDSSEVPTFFKYIAMGEDGCGSVDVRCSGTRLLSPRVVIRDRPARAETFFRCGSMARSLVHAGEGWSAGSLRRAVNGE